MADEKLTTLTAHYPRWVTLLTQRFVGTQLVAGCDHNQLAGVVTVLQSTILLLSFISVRDVEAGLSQ